MTERVCCIRNCFNPQDKKNRRTVFKFCEKSPYFKTWINAIGPNLRVGKKTRKNYYICEQHFGSNLHRSPINILKDGKELTLLRRRPTLKSTSVPYIFPGCSSIIDSNNLESSSVIDSNNLESKLCIDSNDLKSSSISRFSDNQSLPLLCDKSSSLLHTPMECTSENVFNTTVLLKEWNARPSYQSMGSWGVMETKCGLLFILFESTSEHCSSTIQRSLLVKSDMTIELRAHNHPVTYHLLEKVTCLQDIYFSLRKISAMKMCQEESCTIGYFEQKPHSRSNLCKDCQLKNKRKKERENKRERRAAARKAKEALCKKNVKQKYKRIYNQLERYKVELENLKVQCASQKEEILDEAIASFPPVMKKSIKACWRNSRSNDKHGMRYTKDWILESLLLRIKSRKAYVHLRSLNILALPTIGTLNKYIKNFSPSGFALFAMLKEKSTAMKPEERRGTLVHDEMKLSESVAFMEHDL
ncbi:PREDICTED: uncharacterized protein LOC108781797 [Cyphomyrmex costatus]|uniref:uncharacterized protein LOC108781797 n=1 Tax=Cyphomyrmex costatus TaxID=456900 RepID=UPI000852389F|nr:PREDICTED: uncharacterized protein LOC108781797 [Cyphomyrmex costatus]